MVVRRRVRFRRSRGRGLAHGLPSLRPKLTGRTETSRIISFESPKAAMESAERLRELYSKARTWRAKLRVLRAALAAANFARLQAERRENLSPAERQEYEEIARIYRELFEELDKDYRARFSHMAEAYREYVEGGRGSLFSPPRHKDLAEIVTFESIQDAREACRRLKELYLRARTRTRRLTILRAAYLAATRARVFAEKHPNISPEVRDRLLKIAREYRSLAEWMSRDYRARYAV